MDVEDLKKYNGLQVLQSLFYLIKFAPIYFSFLYNHYAAKLHSGIDETMCFITVFILKGNRTRTAKPLNIVEIVI